MKTQKLALSAFAALAACSAFAGHAMDYTPFSGSAGSNFDQSVGWQFDVLTGCTVTDLAWQDEEGDGLSTSHEVGIWDSAGTLMVSGTLSAGTGNTLDGIWRTLDVADTFLAPGTGYIVGGYNGSGTGDVLRYDVSGMVVDSNLSFVDATYSDANGIFERPTNFSAASTGFYGPSFNLAPVPEPATLSALALGAMVLLRRKRA